MAGLLDGEDIEARFRAGTIDNDLRRAQYADRGKTNSNYWTHYSPPD